ncbi:MAG: CsgG/HfaB family protein [Gemmatimonadales bacterium]
MSRPATLSVLAAFTVAGQALAQSGAVVIAILPFEDRGSYGQDKEVFRALELGIPAALGSELGRDSRLRLVERGRVTQALRSQNLAPDARVDAATAAKVASQVGARYAITGNFADFYGKFRIDARIVDAESGQILKVVSNDDPALQDRAELSRILQALGGKIVAAVGLRPSAGTSAGGQARLPPTEALTQYSLGLLYESEGERSKAGEHFQQAMTAFPNYSEAREAMQRLRAP